MKKITITKLLFITLSLLGIINSQTVFLSEDAYTMTSPSSTTPIYHVIKLSDDKITDLTRDEK